MADLPYPLVIACGVSVGMLVAAFFLVGAHHEVSHRRRERRRGGYIR